MPTLTQFGDEIGDDFRQIYLSANFKFPGEVADDQLQKDAVEEWLESLSDEELGEFIRDNATIEPW